MVKRSLAALLVLLTVFLAACGGTITDPGNTGTGDPQGTDAAKTGKTVNVPMTRAQLDAIPVASADMTEDQLRQICLDYFQLQGTIPWISPKQVKYAHESAGDSTGNIVLAENTIYSGLPYTRAGSNLYNFLDFYDEETGVFNNTLGSNVGSVLGNHCAGAVYWAWARISSTITFVNTNGMTRAGGVVKVGSYVIDTSVPDFSNTAKYNTGAVCQLNGEDVMYHSYAALKPADGLVTYNDSQVNISHHTMMCVETNVVYKEGGSIDPDASTVTVYQQQSGKNSITLESGQKAVSISGMNSVLTFTKLYNNSYIPVTCLELAGYAEVQEATAAIGHENGETLNIEDLRRSSLEVNYCLSKITLTVKDSSGKEVAEKSAYGKYNTYEYALDSLGVSLDRALDSGSYTLTITTLLGNGETLTAFEGTLQK